MAKNKYGLIARLVWDGGDEVRIPEELGTPAPNQMQGNPGERVAELSGRACYDSLGRGRSSEDYHKHILEVGHTSVLAHFHLTVEINCMVDALQLLNRPGLWTSWNGPALRVAFNARSIVDWNMWSQVMGSTDTVGGRGIGDILAYHAEKALPMVFRPGPRSCEQVEYYDTWTRVVSPAHEEEKWVSLFLSGSRGYSHEQVRHNFRCGISQRSTRYVDEDGSPWVDHPLVQEFMASAGVDADALVQMDEQIKRTKTEARKAYSLVAATLQDWLKERGVEKLTARKQARGAARGYLGNALQTEMIFSASVGQWKRMLRQRCNDGADAEIRILYTEVLPELLKSRYADSFREFRLLEASDKIGQVAEEKR